MAGQQPIDGSGGADLGLPVRAINRSDETVVWEYARVKHTLLPGRETFVPYMAMVYWQGDPRAIDVPGGRLHEQHRRREREHLRILYGIYEESEGHNKWADVPLVECYPIDSDQRFETVIHDPEGVHLAESTDAGSELARMRQMMEQQANQLRIMQATIQQREHQEAAAKVANFDPEDLERQETEHRVAAPEEVTGQQMVGPSPQRRKTPAPKQKAAVTRDGE